MMLTGELLHAGPGQSYETAAGTQQPYEATVYLGEGETATVRFRDQGAMRAALGEAQERQPVSIPVAARIAGPRTAAASCWVEYRGRNGAN